MPDDGTVSLVDPQPTASDRAGAPSLVLVLHAARPLAPPVRIGLDGVDEVVVGRGQDFRADAAAGRRIRVDLPDRAASSLHARIVRSRPGWTVVDEGSRNGTLLNGGRIESAPLGPDDLLEIGNSFFVIRRNAVAAHGGPAAFRTMSGELARELDLLERVAPSRLPVLIVGETGTGKELVARTAHELSARRGPFVAVNCGAIPATLVESELFGARRGAYSGAVDDRPGTIAAADTGTLFLDEIAELPDASQAALLRVLQEGEVKPLGATRPVRVDIRVLAATHRDLPELVGAGRFRADLFGRLRGHVVKLPPLRARREDLGILVAELLRRAAGSRAAGIALQRAAARALLLHTWPHNVRELEQVVARAVTLVDGDEIRLEHLPDEIARPGGAASAPPVEDRRAQLVEVLRKHGGNVNAVARALATSRSQIQRMIKRYGLDRADFGDKGPDKDDGG